MTPNIKSLRSNCRKRVIFCTRCGHAWLPMQSVCLPSVCPACKSSHYLYARYPKLICAHCRFKWQPKKSSARVCPRCHRVLAKYLKKNQKREIRGTKFQIQRDSLTSQFLVASGDWRKYSRSIRLTDGQIQDITYCLKHIDAVCDWKPGYFGHALANLPTLNKRQAKIALKLIMRFGFSRKLGNEMLAAGCENIIGTI
jgi:hypothetical protein